MIDRSTIIKEANDDRDMFIMDYGSIEHCFTSKICVKIESVADIKSMLNAYNIFHFESYPGYIYDLRFHLKETEKLEASGEFENLRVECWAEPKGVVTFVVLPL